MRLFIAIDCNTQKEYLSSLQKKIAPDGRLTYPKDYHLTLKFLGRVDDLQLKEVKERLSRISFEQFRITLGALGVFPSPGNARVVWIGVKDNDEIVQLQKKIEDALVGIFEADEKFHPHITLARVKELKERRKFAEKILSIPTEPKKIRVNSFFLVESKLSPKGPNYVHVEKYDGRPAKEA